MTRKQSLLMSLSLAGGLLTAHAAYAQASAQPNPQPNRQPPAFTSAEVTADRRIVLRIFAPDAKTVTLNAGDIPLPDHKAPLFAANEQGVWEATSASVPAGAYRYLFVVDGVSTIDPRNPATSESNTMSWSVVVVPGSDFVDVRTALFRRSTIIRARWDEHAACMFTRHPVMTLVARNTRCSTCCMAQATATIPGHR
jgi:enterochelin esterase family protein